jgi:hypothetical protein
MKNNTFELKMTNSGCCYLNIVKPRFNVATFTGFRDFVDFVRSRPDARKNKAPRLLHFQGLWNILGGHNKNV